MVPMLDLASFHDELIKMGAHEKPQLEPQYAPELIDGVKVALGLPTLRAFFKARAAQGVGGAGALGKSLAGAKGTSRQAIQGMSGLQKHQMGGVMQGGKDIRKMQALPSKVGLGQTAQATRSRVGQAVKQEAAAPGVSRRGGVPLSGGYEGYMTASRRSYNPQHMEQVMGLKPGSVQPFKGGPTALQKPQGLGTAATTAATANPFGATQLSPRPTVLPKPSAMTAGTVPGVRRPRRAV